ncbi:hypothetical protein HMPREF0868_0475 [Mageeibacillus indolicus UPII9-5]|uniref:Uncharacterized protein n=1 Tax=Mageeibacillus indolicus (strain UPII9-5) TaxID=699246 RepID=D3R0U9_MAGIU|nr:hypothetical protein HMPREF0868_0475 [Mageeibacillus indolicus UPII9-5]
MVIEASGGLRQGLILKLVKKFFHQIFLFSIQAPESTLVF